MSNPLEAFLDRGQVILHLGAHKTATTSIQMALDAERADLRARGTALLLPRDLRQPATGPHRRRDRATELEQQLCDAVADDAIHRLILSEENLTGSSGHNLARKSLYPSVTRRLGKLPRTLNHPNVTVLFALRDYGPYLSSSATTAIRRGKVFDTVALRTAFLLMHRHWLDVVQDIQAVFPSSNLRLWRYEDFDAVAPSLWREFDDGLRLSVPKRAFKTLSGSAMKQVLAGLDSGESPVRSVIRQAVRDYPITDTNPAYSMWSDDESAHLTALYSDHWMQICDAFPDMVMQST